MEIHNKDTDVKIKVMDISNYPITTIKELSIFCSLHIELKGYLPQCLLLYSSQYDKISLDFDVNYKPHQFRGSGGLCTYLASQGIPRLQILSSTEELFRELVKLTEGTNLEITR
jgi:hypothetical protein